jgi:hypothetical protein
LNLGGYLLDPGTVYILGKYLNYQV